MPISAVARNAMTDRLSTSSPRKPLKSLATKNERSLDTFTQYPCLSLRMLQLERNVGRLRHAQHGLIAGTLLPGRANRFDLVAIDGGIGIVDHQQLRVQSFGSSFLLALPLAIDVDHAQAIRKTRCDFLVEKIAPRGFADASVGMIGRSETEVEPGIDPALCLRWM